MKLRTVLLIGLLVGGLLPASACDPTTFLLLAPTVIKNLGGNSGNDGDPFEQPRDIAALRVEMLGYINDSREEADLPPLVLSSQLNGVAQAHSIDMVDEDFVGHTSPDGSTTQSRVRNAIGEWSYLGENIGAGFATIRKAHNAFMDSDENRKNILARQATQVGIGMDFGDDSNEFKDGIYLTLIFFAPK
ncbi:MAG TPA: CAP domain-containing protein [bacterium]|nr:CAP domain-containing protein [bacterium]